MTAGIARLGERPAWNALAAHFSTVRKLHLRKLFLEDPTRGERLTVEAEGLYLDYSKNRITDETLKLLFQLAQESGLQARIDGMFQGDKINHHRKPSRLARGSAGSERGVHSRGWRERGASSPRRTRQNG